MPIIEIQDVHFHVVDVGNGMPVLLVHGFPLNHTMWKSQIDAFSKTNRIIAPDLRGFGKSSVTPGTVRMEQHADDLAAILDALEIREPVIFCGLSMGGYIGWQFALKYADRLAALIQCDTRAVADTDEARQGRLAMAERVMRDGPGFVAEAMLPKLVGETTAMQHPEIVESIREMILTTTPDGIAAAQRGMAERPDVAGDLAKIAAQALVLVGQHDVISTSAEMRTIADSLPRAGFVEIPGAGHMTPMENPEAVNAAIRNFFAELE